MLNLQEIELEIANLKTDLEKTKTQSKKEALLKQIAKLNCSLKAISAYEAINIEDVVINGDPTKLGVVTAKEIQNQLPIVWVDWNGLKTSSVPDTLKVIPPTQLKWQWIESNYTRLYDHIPCNDMAVLLEELDRLKTEEKVLSSSSAVNLAFSPTDDLEQNKAHQAKIIELWLDAIAFHYPLDEGFFLHNRKVVVKSYQLCKQHNLVFPVVFDGKHQHLAHPLELRRIPLGLLTKVAHGGNHGAYEPARQPRRIAPPQDRTFAQLNIFPEDNADPNEPEEPDEESNEYLNSGEPITSSKEESNEELGKNVTQKITIDPEFKSLIPPLEPEERERLEQTILLEGCRDPLVIWKDHNILIDGHNRYFICTKQNIPFLTVEIELEDRNAVINWMINNQLARRNLKPEVVSYLRGKLYRNLKKQHGGDRRSRLAKQDRHNQDYKSKGQNVPLKLEQESTADLLAAKTGVSDRTVKRDAQYSEAVEAIAQKIDCSPQEIINSSLSKKQVKEMVNLPIESIKQKLENPTFIGKRELPEIKVGDVVRIKSDRKNKDFVGYNGTIAICDRVYENSADVRMWKQLIPSVHKQFLQPVEGDTVTLKVTLSKEKLKNLMLAYDSIEEAIN